MTHSILMEVMIEDYEDVEEIRKRIIEEDDEQWVFGYAFKIVPKIEIYPDIRPSSGMPPFICFPKKNEKDEESDLYHIIVESGSHCSFSDTIESFWMWVAWFYFLQEIDSYGIEYKYKIRSDGEDENWNLNQALKEIIADSELSKFMKAIPKKNTEDDEDG